MGDKMTDVDRPAVVDTRLREDLRTDLLNLQELLHKAGGGIAGGTLNRVQILSAINECAVIAKKTAIVQVVLECADTDGTGTKINVSMALQRLSAELLAESDSEQVAIAREKLKDKRNALVEQTDMCGTDGFIEALKLRDMFTSAPFSLSVDMVNAIMRFFGVKDEKGDSVRISEIMRALCPMLDQTIFVAINAKLTEKYGSVKTAFDKLSKSGKVSRQQLAELLTELPLDLKLRPTDLRDLVNLADADGSGTIEYQEFQVIFGTGDMLARARQANYKKLQDKSALSATERSDSLASTVASDLSAEERVVEVLLGSRASELLAALKEADIEGSGSLDVHTLQGALNKLRLGLSEADVSGLLTKVGMSTAPRVEYAEFLKEVRAIVSTASTLEEAQTELLQALTALLERRGADKMWLVRAFQLVDSDLHDGKPRSKVSTQELAKTVGSMRVALSASLVQKLVKLADSERKDGVVNYADFVRMCGDSANSLRGRVPPSSPSKLDAPQQVLNDELTEEMEEEIREVIRGRYETLMNAFRKFDKDNSGGISRDEMLQGLKGLRLPISDKQLGVVIKRADKDGGGTIDFNEFKGAFDTGTLAEARRDSERNKKLKEEQLKKERRQSVIIKEAEEDVEEVDPKAENYFWLTLQKRYPAIPEAFAFLKGRVGGKHADQLSQSDFCNGLLRLDLMEKLLQAKTDTQVEQLLRAFQGVTPVQKREILVTVKGMTQEAARAYMKKLGIDERPILVLARLPSGLEPPEASVVAETDIFAGTQGKALFRHFNQAASGWFTQAEFIQAQSRWLKAHPKALAQIEEQLTAERERERQGGRETSQLSSAPRPTVDAHVRHATSPSKAAHALRASSKRDAHELQERVRREEMELLKVDSLKQQLAGRVKEVEDKCRWLTEQKELLAAREEALRTHHASLHLPAPSSSAAAAAAAAAPSDAARRSTSTSLERMTELYRDSLDQKRRSMNLYSSKTQEVSVDFRKERVEMAEQMQRVEDLIKNLGLPPNQTGSHTD